MKRHDIDIDPPDSIYMADDFFSVSTDIRSLYYKFPYLSKKRHHLIIINALDLLFDVKNATDETTRNKALNDVTHFLEYSGD